MFSSSLAPNSHYVMLEKVSAADYFTTDEAPEEIRRARASDQSRPVSSTKGNFLGSAL